MNFLFSFQTAKESDPNLSIQAWLVLFVIICHSHFLVSCHLLTTVLQNQTMIVVFSVV